MSQNRTFADYADDYEVCTDFVGAYLRENEQAVAKFGIVDGADHCWVYDPEQDRTLDATLSQFAGFAPGCEADDWFLGDEHPVAEELESHDELEAFAAERGGTKLLED